MREMKENPAVNELLDVMGKDDIPLNPRNAFYGVRTNASTLYFKSDGKTKMRYYDINSLYPFINKTAKTVVKHPKVHAGEEACMKLPWQSMDGLMKVTVLPPRGLAFPVLPYRMHKKLIFFLCFSCAQNQCQDVCNQSDRERAFQGTWVMDEV